MASAVASAAPASVGASVGVGSIDHRPVPSSVAPAERSSLISQYFDALLALIPPKVYFGPSEDGAASSGFQNPAVPAKYAKVVRLNKHVEEDAEHLDSVFHQAFSSCWQLFR
jgi:hypothetical protein